MEKINKHEHLTCEMLQRDPADSVTTEIHNRHTKFSMKIHVKAHAMGFQALGLNAARSI